MYWRLLGAFSVPFMCVIIPKTVRQYGDTSPQVVLNCHLIMMTRDKKGRFTRNTIINKIRFLCKWIVSKLEDKK
jgi:hypothetical protein